MRVQDVLKSKSNWCQGSVARDQYGRAVRIDDHSANSYDLLGALSKCNIDYPPMLEAYHKVEKEVGDIVKWNDDPSRTYEQVIALASKLNL